MSVETRVVSLGEGIQRRKSAFVERGFQQKRFCTLIRENGNSMVGEVYYRLASRYPEKISVRVSGDHL